MVKAGRLEHNKGFNKTKDLTIGTGQGLVDSRSPNTIRVLFPFQPINGMPELICGLGQQANAPTFQQHKVNTVRPDIQARGRSVIGGFVKAGQADGPILTGL